MTVVAFAGPSLTAGDRAVFAGVEWRPPAQAGDLLRLPAGDVSAVCLIDGYFDHRPAVRHKEVLLLLSQGMRILGSSSIGALRAAEMRSFGMAGIGAIFAAYVRGTIVGDDEVALVHAGADRDWRPLSIPLVDVGATLCRARREHVLGRAEARALLNAARSIHYVDREWRGICDSAGLADGAGRFGAWLGTGAVSQKREDALACVRAAIDGPPVGLRPPAFVHTSFVDSLARECGMEIETSEGRARAVRRA